MNKPNYNAETKRGTSQRGMSFHITPETQVRKGQSVQIFNVHPAKGGVIECDTLQDAVERARQL